MWAFDCRSRGCRNAAWIFHGIPWLVRMTFAPCTSSLTHQVAHPYRSWCLLLHCIHRTSASLHWIRKGCITKAHKSRLEQLIFTSISRTDTARSKDENLSFIATLEKRLHPTTTHHPFPLRPAGNEVVFPQGAEAIQTYTGCG
jgi:hypothetical protein